MKLVDPDEKYLDGYEQAYLMALKKISLGEMKKHNLTFKNPKEVDIVKDAYDRRDLKKLKPGYVPSYDYFLIDDKENFIGKISIRIGLTESLLKHAGNIGYGINPLYWNKGYGNKILELGLKQAKHLGLKHKVLVTCDDDNIASAKIIEKNGGILQDVIENNVEDEYILTRRYWIYL